MKSIRLTGYQALILCCLVLLAFTTKAQDSNLQLPRDFNLPAQEIPKGFRLLTITGKERKAGLSRNPGFINKPAFIKALYEHADPKVIEKVYVTMYQPGKKVNFEMGYYVIAYTSAVALNREKEKIKVRIGSGARYFIKERYLMIVWSNSSSFGDAVTHIARYFNQKMDLQEFDPAAAEDPGMTVVDTATAAE